MSTCKGKICPIRTHDAVSARIVYCNDGCAFYLKIMNPETKITQELGCSYVVMAKALCNLSSEGITTFSGGRY